MELIRAKVLYAEFLSCIDGHGRVSTKNNNNYNYDNNNKLEYFQQSTQMQECVFTLSRHFVSTPPPKKKCVHPSKSNCALVSTYPVIGKARDLGSDSIRPGKSAAAAHFRDRSNYAGNLPAPIAISHL